MSPSSSGSDRIRNVRTKLAAGNALLGAVRKDPRIARDLVAGLTGGAQPAQPAPEPAGNDDYTPPAGLSDYATSAHAHRTLTATPDTVAGYLSDLSRLPEWFTLHTGWRGPVPGPAHAGLTFTQQALVMGIPAEIHWTVDTADAHGFALSGEGPQGVRLGYWLTITGSGDRATVYFDTGLGGPPVAGPLGASVVRSLGEAMEKSLEQLPDAVAAAGPRTRRHAEPIRHTASGTDIDPRTPVLVGAGQITQRTPDSGYGDPASLAVTALRRAADDTGADADLLKRADAVFAVASTSWQYRDMGAVIAERLGVTGIDTAQTSPFGGDGGQLAINEAAAAIAAGDYDTVLVTGAEAGATQAAAQREGIELSWPQQDSTITPTHSLGIDKPGNNAAETAAGLLAPINMYALMESANRHRLGRNPADHATAVAQLWSRFSAVAARNEHAWQPEELDADRIAAATADNRMVSTPYTKLECANLTVDMASGVVVCSAAAARDAGIAQDKWIFIHAGASGHDEWFTSERTELAASPAIATLGRAVLEHSGIDVDALTHVDLYACFPVAVQIAARELGLAVDDPARPLTVTGGLTFGGGPGNNYGGHAVATMVQRLRAEPGTFGLASSLGWYATKHALGVYSSLPPAQPYRHLRPIIDHPPARPARSHHDGPAVIEAYTVAYARDGHPHAAMVSLIEPAGARILLRSTDNDLITELVDGDLLGLPVTVAGHDIHIDGRERAPLPPPPEPPVQVERRGAITIITLNRPRVRNAVDLATALLLERALDAYEADPAAQVAIITGAGGYFCAGMDLKAAARGETPMTEQRGPLGITAKPPLKPLIAAVEGPALAGGCELALSADLVVAADDSTFGVPEVKRGLVAVGGGVLRLAQRLPRAVAMELALTGDPITATRAAALGLVNQVTEPGHALTAALELAQRIACNAPLSLAASKRIIDESPDWTTDIAFTRQLEVAGTALASEDAGEGVLAFTQKRPPVWKGR